MWTSPWPSALPLAPPTSAAVPVPDDAQIQVTGQLGMAFTTQLEPEAVLDFYRSALPDWDEQAITDTLSINGNGVDAIVEDAPGAQPEPTPASEDASPESGAEAEADLGITILQFAQGPTALYVTVADPAADPDSPDADSSGTPVVIELLGPLPADWASPDTPTADLSATPSVTETFPPHPHHCPGLHGSGRRPGRARG